MYSLWSFSTVFALHFEVSVDIFKRVFPGFLINEINSPSFRGLEFTVNSPAEYQLSNYNIHPPPVIRCSSSSSSPSVPKQVTIHARLVDKLSRTVLLYG